MVSNSKDDHPSKVTPIMAGVKNVHPKKVVRQQAVQQQAIEHSPVGREKSKQPRYTV